MILHAAMQRVSSLSANRDKCAGSSKDSSGSSTDSSGSSKDSSGAGSPGGSHHISTTMVLSSTARHSRVTPEKVIAAADLPWRSHYLITSV